MARQPLAIEIGLDVAESIAKRTGKSPKSYKGGHRIPKELYSLVGGEQAPKGGLEVRIPSNNPLQQRLASMEGRDVSPESLLRQALAGGERGPIRPAVHTVKESNTNLDLARQRILEELPGPRNPAYDPATKSYATVADHYAAKGTELQKGRFVRGTPPARAKASVAPETKSTTTSPTNRPAASSKVSSEKAAGIAGYENMMGGGATLLTAGAGGLIGGVTSYATGGDFFQGAAAGSIIGAGGVAAGMGIMNANRSFLAKNAAGINDAVSSMSTSQRRNAMFAGAGLSGMVFGGDRRSHRRGFNQSRGNTF